jgi:two-component system NtrC family sensor kinase
VFINLLVNAVQSIDAEGKITLSTGVDDREVWIRIEDTGCGTQFTVRLPIRHNPADPSKIVSAETGANFRLTGDWPDSLSGDSTRGACPRATAA